ncbi:outer membrane protein assembly factor BamD [Nitratiruptor sp. SB155-2]|uniref:outer membrane protein assembly factor BamD n=1 Tax=Nitratiruptor sp. (strain SB155-2) TaxID=387092 RepID=UPI0001587360|nr:outer membrane protein assembly factor BamD [Nitratiruptor sp. SB155-2]BAF70457.1 conserved hypothetical protein [Nitratiruptor sp. SB155-2]
MKKQAVCIATLALLLAGCSSKNISEYNKPDIYWYQKMVRYVSTSDLDKADEYFTSLQSEHFSSPLLKEAMLIMAQAHMDNEEYLMAKYYLDEFIKRYGNDKNVAFAKFLKIKASFLAFRNINRDQKLLQDTIAEAESYKKEFIENEYMPMVDTMLTKLYMAEYVLNEEIVALYERRGKMKAAKIYRERVKHSWLKKNEIDVPTNWYDYLINW